MARDNLAICQTIVNNVEHELSQRGAESLDQQQVIELVHQAWQRTDRPYAGSYLCVVDSAGQLALHTGTPELQGSDVSRVLVNPDSSHPRLVAELLESKVNLALQGTDHLGEAQLLGFAYLPSIDSLVVAHVPAELIDQQIRQSALPWIVALSLVGGLLIPLSVSLLHLRYTTAQRDRETASNALQASESLLREENQLLAAVASGMPLDDSLRHLIGFMESQTDDLMASIMIRDRECSCLRLGAATGLSQAFREAINCIPIAADSPPCGIAAFDDSTVVVADIASDSRCSDKVRELTNKEGIRAGWIVPIHDRQGEVLGTFVIYRRHPGEPTDQDSKLLETTKHLAGLLLSRHSREHDLSRSEARFRAIFEQAAVGVAQLDPETGAYLRVNHRYCEILGVSAEDVLGKSWMELAQTDELDVDQQQLEQLKRGETDCYSVERQRRRPDGTTVWVQLTVSPLCQSEEEPLTHIAIVEDITERKEAEQALRDSEALYFDLYKNAPDMMVSVDAASSKIVRCNQAMAEVLGYPHEEIIGKPVFDVLSAESAEILRTRIFDRLSKTGHVSHEDLTLVCADGSQRDVILNSSAVQDADGKVLYSRSVLRDVTEQRRAEQKLAESESRLRAIFDSEPECVKLVSTDGYVLDMNPAGLKIIEAESLDEIVNQKVDTLVSPEHREAFHEMHEAVIQGKPQRLEFEIIGLKGTRRWMDTHVTPMQDADGKVTALLSVTRDITARKQATAALRESEELFRRLVETAPFGVRRNDLEGRITFANEALGNIFGCRPEEMIGKFIWDFAASEEDRRAMQHHFQRHLLDPPTEAASFEAKRRTLDGRVIDVTIDWTYERGRDGKASGLIVVVTDITERRQSEQEFRLHRDALAQMTRLSTMGELIAGLAHEVKQPLYAITNFATATSVALSNVQHGSPIDEGWLQEMKAWNNGVQAASKRANDIIQRLREFARKGEGKREKTSIDRLLEDSIGLVAFEARQSNTIVTTELADGLADVVIDRIQCEQVLVNLLHNAYEALADHEGQRRVIVRAEPSDEFVEVQIEDNGPGIPTDQNGKLFEAFYTTKPSGMGMGLAISQTIVEDHGGRLWGRANQFGGATFHFTLPAEVKREHLQLKDA